MSCGLEVLANDLGEDAGFGPDTDRWHGCQELVKRVGLHEFFDLRQHLGAGGPRLGQGECQLRQHDPGRRGPGDHHGLLIRGREDLLGPAFPHPGCVLAHERFHPGRPGLPQRGRGRVFGQQLGHGLVVQVRADDPFQGRVDRR